MDQSRIRDSRQGRSRPHRNRVGMDRYAVLGRLVKIWSYFDLHSRNGRIEGIDANLLDAQIGHPGFCISSPPSAGCDSTPAASACRTSIGTMAARKSRSLAAQRQEKYRAKQSVTKVTLSVTRNRHRNRHQIRGEERNQRGEPKKRRPKKGTAPKACCHSRRRQSMTHPIDHGHRARARFRLRWRRRPTARPQSPAPRGDHRSDHRRHQPRIDPRRNRRQAAQRANIPAA